MKISIYDIYTSQLPFYCLNLSVTLTLNLLEQMFQINDCQIIFYHVDTEFWTA